MKTKIFILSFILFFAAAVKAQDMGDIMNQVVKGVKNSAYTSGKSGKNDVISQLNNIKSDDYLGYASVAGSLAGSLKEAAFLPDWATQKEGVLDNLQKAGSMAEVAGGVLDVVKNLNPKMLSGGLKGNMPLITSALGLLSKSK